MELTLPCIVKELGDKPSAKELSDILGGNPADWGRILKGQCKPFGEYHAKLKRVMEVGLEDAGLEMQIAEISRKYGWKTRKGRFFPRTKHLFSDIELFYIKQIVNKKVSGIHFENSGAKMRFYREQLIAIYEEGSQWPKDSIEEETLIRDFMKSL